MSSRYFLLTLAAVLAAFAGGFLLANALNRSEIEKLRSENSRLSSSDRTADKSSDTALSDDEIKAKISQADSDPTNFQYQRNLGIALYRYASMKQDTRLLAEATRIIDRAAALKQDDRELIVARGNAHFDTGLVKKDNSELETARGCYEQALKLKADDSDVQTDLGLTYFLFDPPDIERAVSDFKKSIAIDPRHEKSLVFLIQALSKQQKSDEAKQYLAKLKSINPNNEALAGLTSLVDERAAAPTQ
jgi:tetratricopeptide (TPR) repeat protein